MVNSSGHLGWIVVIIFNRNHIRSTQFKFGLIYPSCFRREDFQSIIVKIGLISIILHVQCDFQFNLQWLPFEDISTISNGSHLVSIWVWVVNYNFKRTPSNKMLSIGWKKNSSVVSEIIKLFESKLAKCNISQNLHRMSNYS